MKRATVVSAIVLSVLLVVAILAVSAHAGKPPSPPGLSKPVQITVSGDINGNGSDAADMAITFSGLDVEFLLERSVHVNRPDAAYVANPDGILSVYGTGNGSRTLSYYYCDNTAHKHSVDACANPDHDPDNYVRLKINNGVVEGKPGTEQIVFQAGSPWEIWRKARPGDPPGGVKVASGSLVEGVIYKETQVQ